MKAIRLFSSFIAIAALVLCASCSQKKEAAANAAAEMSFKDAPPAIQQLWMGANKAMQSNDYAAAFMVLKNLRSQNDLTPKQSETVDATMTAWTEKLVALIEKGDAKAAQAMEEIKASGRRSRP